MTQHKVEGHSGLYKDDETGVIVNKGSSERDRYRIAKEQAKKNLQSQRPPFSNLASLKHSIFAGQSLQRAPGEHPISAYSLLRSKPSVWPLTAPIKPKRRALSITKRPMLILETVFLFDYNKDQ